MNEIKEGARHGLYIVQSGRALADMPDHDCAWAGPIEPPTYQGEHLMQVMPLILLLLAGCASQPSAYYAPPGGLNEYAQMQDYLDCHGSWRDHACFTERGYTELSSPSAARIEPLKASVVHSRP